MYPYSQVKKIFTLALSTHQGCCESQQRHKVWRHYTNGKSYGIYFHSCHCKVMPGVCRKNKWEKVSLGPRIKSRHTPSSPVSECDIKNACHRRNSKKGRTHRWDQVDISNPAEVMAKSNHLVKWSLGPGISWTEYFSHIYNYEQQGYGQGQGHQKVVAAYCFSKWRLFPHWLNTFSGLGESILIGSLCPHNFPESRILWLGGQQLSQAKHRPKRGGFRIPTLGSMVRPLKGLEPTARTLVGSFSVSLCGPAWSLETLLARLLLFSLAADWLLLWAYGREWLPHGSWFFKSSIQMRLTSIF